jgi:hypothetical protein
VDFHVVIAFGVYISMQENQRICPKCGETITYTTKYIRNVAEKHQRICQHCARSRPRTQEERNKMSERLKGKPKSKQHRERIGRAHKGKKHSKSHVQKMIKTKKERDQLFKSGELNVAKQEEVKAKLRSKNPMKNKKHREKQKAACNTVEAKRHRSENMTKRWEDLKSNPQKYKKFIEKRKKTYAEKLARGEIQINTNCWKNGNFKKRDETTEWYDSSFELRMMEYFESLDIKWTKKHKITIPYINEEGISSYYIPDFLVENRIIIETKGWIKEVEILKTTAAKQYCIDNKLEYMYLLGENLNIIRDFSLLNKTYSNYEEYFRNFKN